MIKQETIAISTSSGFQDNPEKEDKFQTLMALVNNFILENNIKDEDVVNISTTCKASVYKGTTDWLYMTLFYKVNKKTS